MKETKFINKDMALMAATTAYIAAVRTGHYVSLRGGENIEEFSIDVHLETEEIYTLPSGYMYSEVEERTFSGPFIECPPFKVKKYYFKF